MKKEYITPSIKAHSIKAPKILAGSFITEDDLDDLDMFSKSNNDIECEEEENNNYFNY